MLKQLIKRLSAEQKALKPARKTGPYKGPFVYGEWPEALTKGWAAASKVRDNRLRITAALNLYHERRGSEYRHGVSESDMCRYKRYLKEITEEGVMPDGNCKDPNCGCHQHRKFIEEAQKVDRCTFNKPLMIVIPPQGIHISCPVHGQHFIPGQPRPMMQAKVVP